MDLDLTIPLGTNVTKLQICGHLALDVTHNPRQDILGAQPRGLGGTHSDTKMVIYTHVSGNNTPICPMIGHFRGLSI